MKYCTESNMQYNIISNLYFIETKFHISAVSVCEEKKGNYAHTHTKYTSITVPVWNVKFIVG